VGKTHFLNIKKRLTHTHLQ